jgi:hypothetical protein
MTHFSKLFLTLVLVSSSLHCADAGTHKEKKRWVIKKKKKKKEETGKPTSPQSESKPATLTLVGSSRQLPKPPNFPKKKITVSDEDESPPAGLLKTWASMGDLKTAKEGSEGVSAQFDKLEVPATIREDDIWPIFETSEIRDIFIFKKKKFKVTDFSFARPSLEQRRIKRDKTILFVIDSGGIIINTTSTTLSNRLDIEAAKNFATRTISLVYKGRCITFQKANDFQLLTKELVRTYAQD